MFRLHSGFVLEDGGNLSNYRSLNFIDLTRGGEILGLDTCIEAIKPVRLVQRDATYLCSVV